MKAPEEINPIPSMIIPGEAQFLHYVAREHYKGDGAIVEFGPLVGGSTHALAWTWLKTRYQPPGRVEEFRNRNDMES
jgi:predicted O-methyltransferase YrrM